MAFCNKLSGVLNRGFARGVLSGRQTPVVLMEQLNSPHCMASSTKLFVGGLSYATDDQSLRVAFNCFGNVTEVKVIIDRDTGRSRGFGFVGFENSESASMALSKMDGQELQGRNICVNYANGSPSGVVRGGFGGGFGKGFDTSSGKNSGTVNDI